MADVLPSAVEAEDAILGCILQSPKAGDVAQDQLRPEMFFSEKRGLIFKTMLDLLGNGHPTEPLVVEAALMEKGIYEDVGGHAYLYGLIGLAPVTTNANVYCSLIRSAWKKRLVLAAATDLVNNIETMSAEEAVSALDEASLEIEQKCDERHELVIDIKNLIDAKREAMDKPEAVKPSIAVPFSFLQPLVGGRMYALAGYMKDGKTACGLQFASEAAKTGEKVGIVSAEMSKTDLFDRWACQLTGLDYWKIRYPHLLDPIQRKRLEEVFEEIEPWKVDVIHDELVDPAKIRRYQRTGKYDLLIIDHLHRFRWRDRHDLEGQIKGITNISMEFDIPVILLSQLSRAGDYSNPFPVPSLRQLRETAMLEMEAAAVWFVYRERDKHHLPTTEAQFIVAANRYGKTDAQPVYFDETTQTFQERGWEPVEVEAKDEKFPF